ncbi:MAG: polyribonucleotide nucleotidyltransferase [Candidatus Desulfovibrio kirbyi]|jgi:polyribonucleotide nucleotidyltransferase|uniref:Polyribonucleotide nucleotidyltransferase n=1 Tax=Candidatus Desulfovibrio kirbyi TaxID=2696086 RepID=A0A6L2R746_9BACT|nr:polyribonucleotide nucleotidyltransferase [Desulfovibrio sp.]GFH63292.1 MAG: polyribonucleotide nucleotidyltransferase [Candidatus Desulfovibrio kirbyi]
MNTDIFSPTRVKALVGGREVVFESGRLANQADGAVWIQCGGTVVLVTVCSQPLGSDKGFFPLTVEYSEKMYAAGRIPGSFFRREIGRPSERETLVSRLIDRPIRPLFPKGLPEDVQVLASVISADQENESDVLALTGASATLMISSLPFAGPVAGGRIGRLNGKFVLNPSFEQQAQCDLNIIFAASRDALTMVEGDAHFLSEDVIIDALEWGRKEIQPLIDAQEQLRVLCGKAKMSFTPSGDNAALVERVAELAHGAGIEDALRVPDKLPRKNARKAVKAKVVEALAADPEWAGNENALKSATEIVGDLEKKLVRARIINEGTRIDGRDAKSVRTIQIQTGVLPRAHGSALFRRGETKSLVITTLGSSTDEQRMDSLTGDVTKRFMLHYNFPPYCVGEVKPVRVSRREIGHGALAEKSLRPVLPSDTDFPFTLRVVAETMESNGSSSMAAVCGGSLSLMDAGVPVSAPVAGVAMGLIKEGDTVVVLTDILGDEDALGDMDFKIAGTAEGVTGVQMDIKVTGLTTDIMRAAMRQARDARMHILDEMARALPAPRTELSRYAPQHTEIFVNPDIIRLIIGPGGKNIKAITAATGASVDIEDSGRVSIFAPTAEALEKAREMVSYYDQRPDIGKNYSAKVRKILELGVIVEVLPNVEALVHVSQLDVGRVEAPGDVARLGEDMLVKVIEINGDRIRASRKAVLLEEQGTPWNPEDTARPPRQPHSDRVERHDRGGRDKRGRSDRR